VTSSVVGRQPSGSCASWRVTVSRAVPSHPHRRHQPSSATTRQASTARSGSSRWPTTSRPRSSRRANVVRSGAVKVASGTSRSSRWAASELPSSEDLDPYPTSDAPTRGQLTRRQPPPGHANDRGRQSYRTRRSEPRSIGATKEVTGGVIVNILPTAGFQVAFWGMAAYVGSKHAARGLTKSLAVDLAPLGVRVLGVAPSFVPTEGNIAAA